MLKKTITFFCVIISSCAFAQVGGETTYRFLNLVASPRQAALGGKVLTNVDYDVTQAIFNPATINANMDNQFALNYSGYLGGISYGNAAYAYTFDSSSKTLHAGITYVNYGQFDGYDEAGNATGAFSGSETAISIGYATQIGISDFHFGTNFKLITSQLERYNSLGFAVDFGVIYINKESGFNAALVARNLGSQITTYADFNERIPFEVAFGMSQTLENVPIRWHVTLENLQQWPIAKPNPARTTSDLSGNQTTEEVGFLAQVVRHAILGAELFPEGGFNIRLGYNFRRGGELRIIDQRNFSGLSAGIGIKINKMRFSYTHAKYTNATNANFFGLQIDLN